MQEKRMLAIILVAGMFMTGCGNVAKTDQNSGTTETTEIASSEITEDTSDSGSTVDEASDTAKNAASEEDIEATANELFRTAINSSDYLTDGTYRLMIFVGSSPISSASENAKDVKGTDYAYLCRYKADDSEEVFCLLSISTYEDGTIRAVTSWPSDIETGFSSEEGMTGAWGMSYGADEETMEALTKALQADYPEYTMISPVAAQVVAGINYRVLCETNNADGETEYAIATIYIDLDGGADVTEFSNIG